MDIEVGDRIELLAMPDDPDPIEVGTTGTVERITPLWDGQTQIGVVWDNGRTLSVLDPIDSFRVLDKCVHCGREINPDTALANPNADVWGHPDERYCSTDCIENERLSR